MLRMAMWSVLGPLLATTPALADCPPEEPGCEAATELYEEADDHIVTDLVDDSKDEDTPSMDEIMEEESPTFEDDDLVD